MPSLSPQRPLGHGFGLGEAMLILLEAAQVIEDIQRQWWVQARYLLFPYQRPLIHGLGLGEPPDRNRRNISLLAYYDLDRGGRDCGQCSQDVVLVQYILWPYQRPLEHSTSIGEHTLFPIDAAQIILRSLIIDLKSPRSVFSIPAFAGSNRTSTSLP